LLLSRWLILRLIEEHRLYPGGGVICPAVLRNEVSMVRYKAWRNFREPHKSEVRRITLPRTSEIRSDLHTHRDQKRNVRIFEPSRGSDTPLSMPLKNRRFLCRSRLRYS